MREKIKFIFYLTPEEKAEPEHYAPAPGYWGHLAFLLMEKRAAVFLDENRDSY